MFLVNLQVTTCRLLLISVCLALQFSVARLHAKLQALTLHRMSKLKCHLRTNLCKICVKQMSVQAVSRTAASGMLMSFIPVIAHITLIASLPAHQACGSSE